MPYGISTYGQPTAQITGALIAPQQQHMSNVGYPGSESNGSTSTVTTTLQTTTQATSIFRNSDDKRLTREAMEKYLRDRNDMIIVVLHAKVSCNVTK